MEGNSQYEFFALLAFIAEISNLDWELKSFLFRLLEWRDNFKLSFFSNNVSQGAAQFING